MKKSTSFLISVIIIASIVIGSDSLFAMTAPSDNKIVEDKIIVYVVSHGWHTGIVVPGNNLHPELEFLRDYFGDHPFYEIGWGDKGFYQSEKITAGIALKAIFWPTPTVMHVVAVPKLPKNYFPNSETLAVQLTEGELESLSQSIAQSFRRKNGQVIREQNGLYGRSRFFSASGRYYITNTCNTWTARMLEAGGVDINSTLTLRARSILRQVRKSDQYIPGM